MDALITGVIGVVVILLCAGIVYGLFLVDEDLSREFRQWWHQLGSYRVRIRVVSKAGANPTARRNPKLLVGRFGG